MSRDSDDQMTAIVDWRSFIVISISCSPQECYQLIYAVIRRDNSKVV